MIPLPLSPVGSTVNKPNPKSVQAINAKNQTQTATCVMPTFKTGGVKYKVSK